MSFFNKIEGILLNFSYILHTRSKHWNLCRISKKMRKIGAVCLCVNFNCSSSSPSSLILFGYLWKCRIEMLLFTRISALLDIILMTYLIAFYRIVCVCVCVCGLGDICSIEIQINCWHCWHSIIDCIIDIDVVHTLQWHGNKVLFTVHSY